MSEDLEDLLWRRRLDLAARGGPEPPRDEAASHLRVGSTFGDLVLALTDLLALKRIESTPLPLGPPELCGVAHHRGAYCPVFEFSGGGGPVLFLRCPRVALRVTSVCGLESCERAPDDARALPFLPGPLRAVGWTREGWLQVEVVS